MDEHVLVLVASHLCYQGQCGFLFECLKSLMRQTHRNIRVCASVSFEAELYRAEFERVVQDRLPTVRFTLHSTQKYQLEHLQCLAHEHLVDGHRYKWVFFCDDDDTYHPRRVEGIISAALEMSERNPTELFYGVKEVGATARSDECGLGINLRSEFWAFAIRPDVLIRFFQIMDGFDRVFLRNRFSDMILREYLCVYRKGNSKIIQFCSCKKCMDMHFYNHRDHDMSVTKRDPFMLFTDPAGERDMFASPDNMSFLILKCMPMVLHVATDMEIRPTLPSDVERWRLICEKMIDPSDSTGTLLREMTDFLRIFTEL